MTKIFNWTVGSFFRSIGRILAYAAIGFVISLFVLNKFPLKKIRLSDLFIIEHVKASSLTEDVIQNGQTYFSQSSNLWTYEYNKIYTRRISSDIENLRYVDLDMTWNSFNTNHKYASFVFTYTQPINNIENGFASDYGTCIKFQCADEDENKCYEWRCMDYNDENGIAMTTDTITFAQFNPYIYYTDGTNAVCSMESTEIVCPINNKTPNKLRLYVNFISNYNTMIKIGVNSVVKYYDSTSQVIKDAIEESTNDTIESQQVCVQKITNWTRLTYQIVFNANSLGEYPFKKGTYKVTNPTGYQLFYTLQNTTQNIPINDDDIINASGNFRVFLAIGNTNPVPDSTTKKITLCVPTNGNQAVADQQQEQYNGIMDTNSTQTESSANSFFSSFDDTDHGGLSSIVTAPLTMVNNMLSNTCVEPSATWKGQTISLPCGSFLWSRPGASDLQNLLNVFYGGFICFYAIRKLFLMIESLKDPTQDRIEVLDL